VLGKRSDGYHEIDTVFVAIDCYDDLEFEGTDSGGIALSWRTDDPDFPTHDLTGDDSNLIVRAVRLVERERGLTAHLRIGLIKRIPIAAGLGGGSADAAATLAACNRLLGLNETARTLSNWAAQLGSDVPFFLGPPCARGRGRGEVLEPVECSTDWWALLVCPSMRLSAAEVYGALRLTGDRPFTDTLPRLAGNGFIAAIGGLHNDLEQVVIGRAPVVQRWRSQLSHAGARCVLVSGSGPTVVGIFDFAPDPEIIGMGLSPGDRMIVARPVATRSALIIG